jgi:hypothetical protein
MDVDVPPGGRRKPRQRLSLTIGEETEVLHGVAALVPVFGRAPTLTEAVVYWARKQNRESTPEARPLRRISAPDLR